MLHRESKTGFRQRWTPMWRDRMCRCIFEPWRTHVMSWKRKKSMQIAQQSEEHPDVCKRQQKWKDTGISKSKIPQKLNVNAFCHLKIGQNATVNGCALTSYSMCLVNSLFVKQGLMVYICILLNQNCASLSILLRTKKCQVQNCEICDMSLLRLCMIFEFEIKQVPLSPAHLQHLLNFL